MKGFSQFLVEAETSKAAAEAKRLQLTSDGHGGWTDRSGKYVAKTEGGKLVFSKEEERNKKTNQKQRENQHRNQSRERYLQNNLKHNQQQK